MINLLPAKQKDELLLWRAKNLAVILGNVIIVFLICLILVLFLIKFYILTEISNQETEGSSQQKQDTQDLKDIIQKYNKNLPIVLSFYQKGINMGDLLDNISKTKRPEGLYFKSIYFDGKKDANKISVSISGYSNTRDNLLLFKNDFEKDLGIKNIYFTPESWINSSNLNFNLSFDILKK